MFNIIIPIFNEEENLDELIKKLKNVTENNNLIENIIFINNGSSDNSFDIIKNNSTKFNKIKYISLVKNCGHQNALFIGIEKTKNNGCIFLDGDLQHPPELISKLIDQYKLGFQIVSTTKNVEKDERLWKRIGSNLYYKLIKYLSKAKIKKGQSDFCLIGPKAIMAIKQFGEQKKNLKFLISELGFSQNFISYKPAERKYGKSKFNFVDYIELALESIFSFSTFPIRLFFYLGSIILVLSIIYGLIILFGNFFQIIELINPFPRGWSEIVLLTTFFGGIQIFGIGLIGKYIEIQLNETKKRPKYFIDEEKTNF